MIILIDAEKECANIYHLFFTLKKTYTINKYILSQSQSSNEETLKIILSKIRNKITVL